jgi:hypothetical protein
MRHSNVRGLLLAGLVIPILLSAGAAHAMTVTFGNSWDNVPLQQILDARYGVGVINVATDYEGHNPGDADPPYWQDVSIGGLIVREIAGYANANTMGWYAETLNGIPAIDGSGDGVIFSGSMSQGAVATVAFPSGLTRFGFWLNPNGNQGSGAWAPEPEMFFSNRFYNDIGTTGAGATHAPFDGDVQCLVFNISHLYNGVPTYIVAWEDLDYGASITAAYTDTSTDNDFNDLVVEIQAASPVPVESASWGSVKALFRQ